jgi:Mycobacterial 4 TMS phage holin, superfamily IV
MKRLLLRTVVFLGSSAIGLLVAWWLIDGFSMSVSGFIVAVVVFSVAQAVLAPLIAKIARRYASALLGGVGLISTLVALILAHVFTHGLNISGLGSWAAATVLVWLVTALATLLLPILLKPKETASKT